MTVLLCQVCFRELSGTPLPNENGETKDWSKTEVINGDLQTSNNIKDKKTSHGMKFMLE